MTKTMHIIKQLRLLALLALPLLLSACIEFEDQILTYTIVDNELVIFQEYRGLFAEELEQTKENEGKKKTEPTDDEKQEIDSVVNGERTFFFDNWILEYNRVELLKDSTVFENPEKELSEQQKQYRQIWLPLTKLLLDNVKITNGDFYYDEQRRLSGYQIVRVKNVQQLVDQANQSISQAVLAEQESDPKEDDPERELIPIKKALAKSGHKWIELDGNRITVTFPATQKQYLESRNDAEAFNSKGAAGVNISYKDNLMQIVIGNNSDDLITLSKRVFGPYTTNAVNYIASKYAIKENLDIPEIKQSVFQK